MRIVYLGLPLGALCLLRAGVPLSAVLIGHPDAPGMRRLRRNYRGLLLARPDLTDPQIGRTLASLKPELILSWFWPFLIPKAVLDQCKQGAFGVHPSLLPRYRGPDPIYWTLRNGDQISGVTLHRLRAEYDTGEVAAQIPLQIRGEPNAGELARTLDRPSLWLMVAAGVHLFGGGSLLQISQEESGVSMAPRPSDQDLSIDWTQSTVEVLRCIRAALPYPRASAKLGEAIVEIVSAQAGKPLDALSPGEAYRSSLGPQVRTQDGSVTLTQILGEELMKGADINALVPTATAAEQD